MIRTASMSDHDLKKQQLNILSIAEGFFQSSVLFALLKLNIFNLIGENGKTLDYLATNLGTPPETLGRLLNAGVVLNLLNSSDGVVYTLASASKELLLSTTEEQYLGNWILNLDYFRYALSMLDVAVLKSGPVIDPSTHLGSNTQQTREYILAMHNYASLRGKELSKYLDTSKSKKLLDLGCGPGTYSFQLGIKNPELQIHLLDLPNILEITKEVQKRYPVKNKIYYLPLDVTKEEIPGSYDMILVSNILHMLGENENQRLIKRLYQSLNLHGSLVIQAQYLQDNRLGGRWPIFLDLIQLCTTTFGKNHSVKETVEWMEKAGFVNIQHQKMTLLNTNSFLQGFKI